MLLLYLSIAYMVGIVLGHHLWDAGRFGCEFPSWLWIIPLALLPCLPILNRLSTATHALFALNEPAHPMRWPRSAGFTPPRPSNNLSPALIAALLLCMLAGILRYVGHPLTPCWQSTDLAYYNLSSDSAFDFSAPRVTVIGYINSYPLVADTKQRMHITVQKLIDEQGQTHEVAGALRLSTGIRQRYVYGQAVKIEGRLVTPPILEDFNYRQYLSHKGIHSLLYDPYIDRLPSPNQGNAIKRALYTIRARGEALINRRLPEPYAALANGMLLGVEAGIPDDLYEQFNLTGTSHVIVISGSNVALISGVILALAQRLLGGIRVLFPTLLGIAAYALLVGGDAAVLRAAFMGGLFVTATVLGRRNTALVSLAFACWVMVLINPLFLWDLGFQLSSAAIAGLVLFTPSITALFEKMWPGMAGGHLTGNHLVGEQSTGISSVASSAKGVIYGVLQDGLIVTIAASITTMPLVVYHFGRLSVVSLLTNLLIAPVQSVIMLIGSLAVVVGLTISEQIAQILFWLPWLSLVWTVIAVQWTAELPAASLDIASYGTTAFLMTYAGIALLRWRGTIIAWLGNLVGMNHSNPRPEQRRQTQMLTRLLAPAAGLLSVVAILAWLLAFSQPDGRLHIHFLDIGQGDGMLIQTPSGRQVLIDGGTSPQQLFSQLGEVMPFWDRHLDMLLLTHPDGDHMAAQVEVPSRFQVDTALGPSFHRDHPDATAWRANLAQGGAVLETQDQGGWLDLGDGVSLWVLWPPPAGLQHGGMSEGEIDNENSLVTRLVYGDFSLLLTGDAGIPSEQVWLDQNLPLASTVLKVGHHGSSHSSLPEFVDTVNPALAVIQVGKNNYGHPTEEVLATLADRQVYRNDQHGRVHLYSDGQQMWVEAERGK